jgi:uncharacterized protein (DUF736 family)
MATIGTFKTTDNGFSGTIRTLDQRFPVELIREDHPQGDRPDYRAFSDGFEVGAGWIKTAQETGREYVSLKFDAPSFRAPIFGNLVDDGQGGHNVFWSRRERD